MNRRNFLKWLGYTAAAVAMPAIAVSAVKALDSAVELTQKGFDPTQQYGNYVIVDGDPRKMSAEWREKIFEVIEKQMRSEIPSAYWNKVTYIEKGGEEGNAYDPFVELGTIAWKYSP